MLLTPILLQLISRMAKQHGADASTDSEVECSTQVVMVNKATILFSECSVHCFRLSLLPLVCFLWCVICVAFCGFLFWAVASGSSADGRFV